MIATFEWLALGVLVACVVFLVRRNILPIARFRSPEMKGWPKNDANIILVVEVLLMFAFLSMNAADDPGTRPVDSITTSQRAPFRSANGCTPFTLASPMPASSLWSAVPGGSTSLGSWPSLVYVPYSKHFHIFLGLPQHLVQRPDSGGKHGQHGCCQKGSGPDDVRRSLCQHLQHRPKSRLQSPRPLEPKTSKT